MKIPFLGAAYQSRSLNFSAQRCVNMYLEFAETENADTQVLYGTPGLKLFSTLTTGNQIRGQYNTDYRFRFSKFPYTRRIFRPVFYCKPIEYTAIPDFSFK